MEPGLEGRVGIVTGRSDGLARAAAERLGAEGARVVICGRRPAPRREVAARVRLGRGEALGVVAQVTRPAERGSLVTFLASAPAACVTGVAISFDGGLAGVV